MKIMVTLDGSPFAEAVVEPAAQLAREAKAEVYLVQVLDPSDVHSTLSRPSDYAEDTREAAVRGDPFTNVSSSGVVETSGQALERIEKEAKEYLQQVGHRFDPIHPEVVVLVGEDVDEELVRFAGDQKVDIIAISSHGRTGLRRLFVGSHAQRLLEHGVAPVLIVRPGHLREP